MALLSRLRRIRASSWMSLRTSAEQATKCRSRPSLRATWVYSAARFSSSSLRANGAISALITPASSLEISTRVPSEVSTSSRELLTLRTSGTVCRLAALQQCAGEQPRRVERLQQVMADRGEELGLRQVGLLGLALGLAQARLDPAALIDLAQQLVVERGQFGGALGAPAAPGADRPGAGPRRCGGAR